MAPTSSQHGPSTPVTKSTAAATAHRLDGPASSREAGPLAVTSPSSASSPVAGPLIPHEHWLPSTPAERPSRARMSYATRQFAAWMRWLHIYLSMLGFTVVLFFSVTGLTLNHPNWFPAGDAWETSTTGQLDVEWLKGSEVNRLNVVEHLRQEHNIHAALAEFSVDDLQCIVVFKGPAISADAFIDRETGQYELTQAYQGLVAVMNDLHKGRDTGRSWSWLIDVSAILMTVVSLTGFALIFFLKRRRISGLVWAGIGTVAACVVLWMTVPS